MNIKITPIMSEILMEDSEPLKIRSWQSSFSRRSMPASLFKLSPDLLSHCSSLDPEMADSYFVVFFF